MKKKFFLCFHPIVLESETEQNNLPSTDGTVSPSIIVPKNQKKNGLKISGQTNKPKRPFSRVLEILLFKASLKMKGSDRNVHQLSLQPKNEMLRRMYRRLQISDDETRIERTEEANVSQTEIRSSVSSSSSYDSENTRSPTVGKTRSPSRSQTVDHKDPENHIIRKPCSCKSNPGLYLFVFALFFTVVWGRATAIFFTLVFLYLFPMWAAFGR